MDHQNVMTGMLAIALIGVGATAVMDIWAFIQKRMLGVPSLDYRLVGRWLGHMPRGRFKHDGIGKAPSVNGEWALGWGAHYAIGVAFAAILLLVWPDWLHHPKLLPALIVGVGSIVAPFFIMQPSFGAGIAASKTPKPWLSRFRSLVAHTSFAIGLYLSGHMVSALSRVWPS